MKKSLLTLTVATILLFAVSTMAANKVVVIPMGSSKVPGNLKTISVSSLGGVAYDTSIITKHGSDCSGSNGRYTTTGASDFLIVPIQLPDGATVTSFTGVFCAIQQPIAALCGYIALILII